MRKKIVMTAILTCGLFMFLYGFASLVMATDERIAALDLTAQSEIFWFSFWSMIPLAGMPYAIAIDWVWNKKPLHLCGS